MKKIFVVIMVMLLSLSTSILVFAEDSDSTSAILTDGCYSVGVTSSSTMFNVNEATLFVEGEEMRAVITLGGTGYSKLFMGTKEEASGADTTQMIDFIPDSEGKYTFEIPVSALDSGISVAAFSTNKSLWYDRTLIFNSSTMKEVLDPEIVEIQIDEKGKSVFTINAAQNEDITIPEASLTDIQESDLTIITANGKVCFSKEAVAGIIQGASGDVTLSVRKSTNDSKFEEYEYDLVTEFGLTDSDGNPLFTSGNSGSAIFVVPYEKTVTAGMVIKVYYLKVSGRNPVEAAFDSQNKTVTFETTHFSRYGIIQESLSEPSAPPTSDQNISLSTTTAPVTGDSNIALPYIFAFLIGTSVFFGLAVFKKKI